MLFLLLPLPAMAQDITGMWSGFLQTAGTRMHYELAITENEGKLGGYSITVFTIDGIENTGVKTIKLKNKKGKVSLEDYDLIYNNYSTSPKPVKLFGDLSLITKDTIMVLEGSFITRSKDVRYINENVYKGTIYLQKQNNITQSKLLSKLEEMKLMGNISFMHPESKEKEKKPVATLPIQKEKKLPAISAEQPSSKQITVTNASNIAADIAKRKTAIIRTVFIRSDSLVINLFDNGQIDGDTVSVMLNGKIIIAKKGLTANAISQAIYMKDIAGDSLVLVMYAENLGSIPPNTGLLILQDGDERYEIRFSGDLQNNSAIVLKKRR